MPDNPNRRPRAGRPRVSTSVARAGRQRRRMQVALGGILLVLVLGIGVWLRSRTDAPTTAGSQAAGEKRYTRGTAGAPVVISEFSDYT